MSTDDRELRLLLALTRRLPPLPKMLGVANHLARRAYLRRRRPEVEVDAGPLRLALDPSDLVEGLILFCPHLYGRPERRFLARHLAPGDVFLDLGAHVGFFALHAARRVGPRGRVLAVEPEPTSFERLTRNISLNDAARVVTPLALAVSDHAGTATLWTDTTGNRGASSLLGGPGPGVTVRCVQVAALLAEQGVDRVAAAKLDLEGLDARVLRAWLGEVPADRWPRALVVEHHPGWVARTGDDPREVLREAGYRVRRGSRHNLLATR